MTPPEKPSDARSLLHTSREHAVWLIQLADMKANVLMASSTILAGLLVQQSVPTCNESAKAVSFLAIGLALASAASAVLTLIPRTRSVERDTLLFFRTALEFDTSGGYYDQVKGLTALEVDRELAGQIWELARIEERKYRWLRLGFVLFGLCLPVAFVGFVWSHLPCP